VLAQRTKVRHRSARPAFGVTGETQTDTFAAAEEHKVITNRDRDVVDWIARIGAVEPVQVMYRFGMGRTVTYRRLTELEAAGLIERVRLIHGQPGLIVATLPGLRLCGLEHLGVARLSAGAAAHWQASSLVAVLLERKHGRGSVGGVREIRAAERATRARVASTRIGSSTHLPDLVVWGPDGAARPGGMAVEVELTAKAPVRLNTILRSWRHEIDYGAVASVLYVCTPVAYRAVARAMADTFTERYLTIVAMPAADILVWLREQEAAA
jgi:hypothetical protein